jgi:hypothetical protein
LCVFGLLGFAAYVALRFPDEDRIILAGFTAVSSLLPIFWFLYSWLTPRTIEVFEDGLVVFEGPFRRREIRAQDLEYIRVRQSNSSYLLFVYRRGTIQVLHHFNGFHNLVAELKSFNPNLETIGC